MNCRRAQGLLVALADDELRDATALLVAEHLEQCSECTDHFERLAAVAPRPAVAIPPGLRDRYWVQLDDALDSEWTARQEHDALPRWRRVAQRARSGFASSAIAYAALAVVLLALGASLWPAQESAPERTPIAAAPVEISAEHYRPAAFEAPFESQRRFTD